MPLALIEALALQVPVVATDCCTAVRLLLDDGRYGDVVPPEDVDALAGAIAAHLRAPERLRTAAAAGLAHAAAFDVAATATAYLGLLGGIAGLEAPVTAVAPAPTPARSPRTAGAASPPAA